jgi:hypothetical protein
MRIGLYERMITWQPGEEVSRRLRTAQPRALPEHGIDPRSVPVGRTVAIGHHHRLFSPILPAGS